MTYDITMCDGKGCEKRATCHRAKMFNRYKKDKSSKPPYVAMVEATEGCQYYLEGV